MGGVLVKKKLDIEHGKIDKLRQKEILLIWIKNKILAIQNILSTRPLYEKQLRSLDFVTDLLGEGMSISLYSFSSQKVDFEILAFDSDAVKTFTDDLMEQNKDQSHFKMLKIESVELEKEGGYSLSFTATLAD